MSRLAEEVGTMKSQSFYCFPKSSAILVLALVLLAGCSFPVVNLILTPQQVSVLQGDQLTITTEVLVRLCQAQDDDELPCIDIKGQIIDIRVENVPTGVNYSIDDSLRSPSTPGVTRITFQVAPDARPGIYAIQVHAVLDGHLLDRKILTLRILPLDAIATSTAAVVAASGSYSLAALNDGTVLAWGDNSDGQLGTGDRSSRSIPTAIAGLDAIVALAVSGSSFPGGHVLALAADGTVWAWGSNSRGQLGDGTTIDRTAPVPVLGLSNVIAIAAGGDNSYAVTNDGTVWAWGSFACNLLGAPDVPDRHIPQPVAGISNITGIASGDDFVIALGTDGTVWIWGDRLGDDVIGCEFETPTQIARFGNIEAIAAGAAGHALMLGADGTVWALGRNESGQLGDGTTIDRTAPVPVQNLNDVQMIAAGSFHSLALTTDGAVWAWGSNNGGMLVGDGTTDDRTTPVHVPGLADVQSISGGGLHSLALLDCGQVWAWGRNDYGQLGFGSRETRSFTPAPVLEIGDDNGCDKVRLTVSLAGENSNGTVTTDIGQLDCSDFYGLNDCTIMHALLDRDSEVTLSAQTEDGFFERWAIDCDGADAQFTLHMDASKHCAAVFRLNEPDLFLLSVVTSGGGAVQSTSAGSVSTLGPSRIDCEEDCSAIFEAGSLVTLTAVDQNGFGFDSWSGDCSGSNRQNDILMDDHKTCRADFRAFEITVNVTGSGTVSSDPAGINCGDACSFAPGTGTVALSAIPALGWQFDGWGGDCQGADNPFMLSMDNDKACTANFSRIPGMFILTVTTEGDGTVTSDPAGIDCAPDCAALFPAGSTVTLTAHPGAGQTLLTWFEDCQAPGDTVDILMDGDKLCHAPFVDFDDPEFPLAQFTSISVREVGQIQQFDGSASCVFDPDTGVCDPAGIVGFFWDFNDDGTVEVSGDRAAAALAQFVYQSAGQYTVRLTVRGGNSGPNGTFGEHSDVLELNIRENTAGLFNLSVSKAGAGDGAIASEPPGLIECDAGCNLAGPLQLASGSQFVLVATAEPGSSFGGWSGAGCTSASPNVSVEMLGTRFCTATFNRNRHTLSVVNNGDGRVLSNPAGIDCGADCDEIYDEGTMITLTAVADAGFQFAGWSNCPAANGNQCDITLNAPRTVTVTFTAVPSNFVLQVNKIGAGTGTVTSLNVAGINCGADCSESLPQGTLVGLQAVADPGSTFISWTGCDDADGDICTVTMNSDRNITAEFQ